MHWYFYIGLVASVLISIFTLPQLISLIKTRNTVYINIPMYAIYLIGCFLFFIGGVLMLFNVKSDSNPKGWDEVTRLSSAIPLIIAQGTCGVISSTIFIWKLRNYFAAKKAKTTEAKYCENLKRLYDEYKQSIKNLSNASNIEEIKEIK